MASIPALSKSYCTYANVPFPNTTSTANVSACYLFNLKLALMDQVTGGTLTGTRHANSVWTCVGSSNGTVAGMDAVDRWGTTFSASNFVRAADSANHSWFVLYNATSNLYLLLDLLTTTETSYRVVLSRTAFVVNATDARRSPQVNSVGVLQGSGADSLSAIVLFNRQNVNYEYYTHITFADDGQFYYLVNRAADGFICAGTFAVRLTGGADVYEYALVGGTATNVTMSLGRGFPAAGSAGGVNTTAGFTQRNIDGGAPSGGLNFWSFAGTASNEIADFSDALTQEVTVFPVSAWGASPLVYRGALPDCYVMVGGRSGTLLPSIAAPSWIALNHLLVPYVGAAPLL